MHAHLNWAIMMNPNPLLPPETSELLQTPFLLSSKEQVILERRRKVAILKGSTNDRAEVSTFPTSGTPVATILARGVSDDEAIVSPHQLLATFPFRSLSPSLPNETLRLGNLTPSL